MTDEPDTAAALMKRSNEDALVSRPVSKAVGNAGNKKAGVVGLTVCD
jgi:hypothetical protein